MYNNESETKKNVFKQIISGNILLDNFLLKQFKLIILLTLLTLFFISNKYSCINKVLEIEILKKRLINAKRESINVMIEIAPYTRISKIEKLLKSKKMKFYSKIQIYELYR